MLYCKKQRGAAWQSATDLLDKLKDVLVHKHIFVTMSQRRNMAAENSEMKLRDMRVYS